MRSAGIPWPGFFSETTRTVNERSARNAVPAELLSYDEQTGAACSALPGGAYDLLRGLHSRLQRAFQLSPEKGGKGAVLEFWNHLSTGSWATSATSWWKTGSAAAGCTGAAR